MRFPRPKGPPSTDNATARQLVHTAAARCEGCRLSWRLEGWRHREPVPIECTAKEQRQALRDIAASARKTEAARCTSS